MCDAGKSFLWVVLLAGHAAAAGPCDGLPTETDARFNTPLHQAVRSGRAACVYLLLQSGANPFPPNRAGETAHLIARRYPEAKVRAQILALFENPAMLREGVDAMEFAVLRGLDPIVTVLVDAGADVNTAGRDGRTALHHAALKGRLSTVQLLLGLGARVDTRDQAGSQPLHDAVLGGNVEVVQALLGQGADVGSVITETGETALHLAASWGRLDVIQVLLAVGARLDVLDLKGRTARDAAMRSGQSEAARLLGVKR